MFSESPWWFFLDFDLALTLWLTKPFSPIHWLKVEVNLFLLAGGNGRQIKAPGFISALRGGDSPDGWGRKIKDNCILGRKAVYPVVESDLRLSTTGDLFSFSSFLIFTFIFWTNNFYRGIFSNLSRNPHGQEQFAKCWRLYNNTMARCERNIWRNRRKDYCSYASSIETS